MFNRRRIRPYKGRLDTWLIDYFYSCPRRESALRYDPITDLTETETMHLRTLDTIIDRKTLRIAVTPQEMMGLLPAKEEQDVILRPHVENLPDTPIYLEVDAPKLSCGRMKKILLPRRNRRNKTLSSALRLPSRPGNTSTMMWVYQDIWEPLPNRAKLEGILIGEKEDGVNRRMTLLFGTKTNLEGRSASLDTRSGSCQAPGLTEEHSMRIDATLFIKVLNHITNPELRLVKLPLTERQITVQMATGRESGVWHRLIPSHAMAETA